MGSTEHIDRVTDLRAWPGDFPVSHLYTMGVAGERFFREMKDSGRILGTRCAACDYVHVPPSIFCPRCFAALDEWKEVGPQGTVRAVTIAHHGVEGEPLDPPEMLALAEQIVKEHPELGGRAYAQQGAFTDAAPALKAGLKTIGFLGFTGEGWIPDWHNKSDVFANVDADAVDRAERFVWEVLKQLDERN